MASKRINYLAINLSKKVNDLYSENYKILMNETEDYTEYWKYMPHSWMRIINIAKISILPDYSHQFKINVNGI